MNYIYYPGCSLEGTAREYDISTRACLTALGAGLKELADWTCCGASAAEPVSALLSLALPARNLALAEQMQEMPEMLVPCSACYLNLKKTGEKSKKDPALLETINQDFCPASRIHYFDVSRETFGRGSPAYEGTFRADYRTSRPSIVETLGAEWTRQSDAPPPEHLDVVHLSEKSAVAFDPKEGRLHALGPGQLTLRFVPTDSAGA